MPRSTILASNISTTTRCESVGSAGPGASTAKAWRNFSRHDITALIEALFAPLFEALSCGPSLMEKLYPPHHMYTLNKFWLEPSESLCDYVD